MFLKNYQIKVVRELKRFFQTARETRDAIEAASKALPENLKHTLNWVQSAFGNLHKSYNDSSVNGFGNYYPRVCIKVPTGGGKTLLAVEAIGSRLGGQTCLLRFQIVISKSAPLTLSQKKGGISPALCDYIPRTSLTAR